MSAEAQDRWRERLVASVDRTLERAYVVDPLLYAERSRVRNRVGQGIRPTAEPEATELREEAA